MNRIEDKFQQLDKENRKAFIPYICYGYPSVDITEKLVLELSKSGADIIELGFPFSDPLADGPTVQYASQKALENKVTLRRYFSTIKKIRKKTNIPLVIMTYYNIIFKYGLNRFIKDAIESGLDGAIIPDLPVEESGQLSEVITDEKFSLIYLIAPTTTDDKIKNIVEKASGFVYYVSLTGVTGARKKLSSSIEGNIKRIKKFTKLPVCVGFGISKSSQIKKIVRVADGVIVGSAIIDVMKNNYGSKSMVKKTGNFVETLAQSTKL